jgi:predicted DNA-binding ribbon-helix-helix protein
MASTIRTTLNLDKNIMQTIKIMAINKETTQTKVINELLEKAIEKETIKSKIPNYLIANKNKKPDRKEFKKSIGMMKAPKGFNPVEAVRETRTET